MHQNLWSQEPTFFSIFYFEKRKSVFFPFISFWFWRGLQNFFRLLLFFQGRKDYSKLVLNSVAADPKDLFRRCRRRRRRHGTGSIFKDPKNFFVSFFFFFFYLKCPIFFFLPLDIDTWNVLSVKETVIIGRFNVLVLKFHSRDSWSSRGKETWCDFRFAMLLAISLNIEYES